MPGSIVFCFPPNSAVPELPHVEAMRLVERVAWAHGSTGWCVVVNNALATLMALFISEDGARQIFGQRPDVTVSGNGSRAAMPVPSRADL